MGVGGNSKEGGSGQSMGGQSMGGQHLDSRQQELAKELTKELPNKDKLDTEGDYVMPSPRQLYCDTKYEKFGYNFLTGKF